MFIQTHVLNTARWWRVWCVTQGHVYSLWGYSLLLLQSAPGSCVCLWFFLRIHVIYTVSVPCSSDFSLSLHFSSVPQFHFLPSDLWPPSLWHGHFKCTSCLLEQTENRTVAGERKRGTLRGILSLGETFTLARKWNRVWWINLCVVVLENWWVTIF